MARGKHRDTVLKSKQVDFDVRNLVACTLATKDTTFFRER